MQATIPVSFEKFMENYYDFKHLPEELTKFMSHTPGTSCCVQISHALNMTGVVPVRVSQTFPSQRRNNDRYEVKGIEYYLILAVDEMEKYLTDKFGSGESIHLNEDNKRRSVADMKKYLQGRRGILVFRGPKYADWHTEPWNGRTNAQGSLMAIDDCFDKPRVLFWDCGPPKWLDDYMKTQ